MIPQAKDWIALDAPASECDVASAAASAEGIVLSFGVREPGEVPGSLRVRLVHQVVLERDAAGALRTMVARLLDDSGKVRA